MLPLKQETTIVNLLQSHSLFKPCRNKSIFGIEFLIFLFVVWDSQSLQIRDIIKQVIHGFILLQLLSKLSYTIDLYLFLIKGTTAVLYHLLYKKTHKLDIKLYTEYMSWERRISRLYCDNFYLIYIIQIINPKYMYLFN